MALQTAANAFAVVPAKPNPWAKGEAGREIKVEAALGLQFAQKTLKVRHGERVSLTFKNPDVVPHNWVLLKPGKLQSIGDAANKMITDPQGLAHHYVPESPDVLVYTDMTNPGNTFTIHFTAPDQPGDYPYLCTFPGHWMVMNGVAGGGHGSSDWLSLGQDSHMIYRSVGQLQWAEQDESLNRSHAHFHTLEAELFLRSNPREEVSSWVSSPTRTICNKSRRHG